MWKLAVLLVVLLSSAVIYRPFCKYICPLGAFYALFSKVGFISLKVDQPSCVKCGKCADVCRMGVDPSVTPNSAECIRCGCCVDSCPQNAIHFAAAGKEFYGVRLKLDKHLKEEKTK